jgi:hypothetical protein
MAAELRDAGNVAMNYGKTKAGIVAFSIRRADGAGSGVFRFPLIGY